MVHSGKMGPGFMERVVYDSLGRSSRRVIVGPGRGLDNAVVSLGHGKVMILTVDPISAVPRFGMKLSAWLSVHLIASDYTTSGFDPEFAIFSYNLPPTMSQSDREEYVRSVGDECKRLGVAIAAGHTGSYPGGGYTVVGAGTMLGLAPDGSYITPSMARAGDLILMTKHAAIEAAGSLALSFPKFAEQKVGSAVARRARDMIRLCTTVKDARAARKIGTGDDGISSMHDATEGGVLGA
jgi:hydrogenase expression/formation protein HypE